MTHKKKFVSNTKTIYYAIVQKLEVPVNATEKEIDDIELCIKGRIKENKYQFRSKDYVAFIESISIKLFSTSNLFSK